MMNNQITILDRNNQQILVDLICYFSSNNKKYIFYSKNEMVQDGLIKMYVAEENNGLSSDISQDDWNNLKKIMQSIITGNNTNIEFIKYNQTKFNEAKAIALNDSNINVIKKVYKDKVGDSGENNVLLNKDILSQNFGTNQASSVQEPVQISAIPNIQNNFNMESTPVNLEINPILESTPQPISNLEPIQTNAVPSIEPIPSVGNLETNFNENEMALNINSIKPGGIDSGFKVSNEPNIFDNPMSYQITEEEVNRPVEINNSIENEVSDIKNVNTIKNVDSNLKKIELNNKKIKLFEELANVYREENELLGKDSEESSLEHTASNLFNNNGTLIDNEVLN